MDPDIERASGKDGRAASLATPSRSPKHLQQKRTSSSPPPGGLFLLQSGGDNPARAALLQALPSSPAPPGGEPLLEAELKAFAARRACSRSRPCAAVAPCKAAWKMRCASTRNPPRPARAGRAIKAPYRHEDDLYALALRVDWRDWITLPKHTLRVDVTAQRSPLQSLNFAALRIKDAIRRPTAASTPANVPAWTPAGPTCLWWYASTRARGAVCGHLGRAALQARLAHRQGRRPAEGDPGRRHAGCRRVAGDSALHDPCCGSGTIPIEAALIATDTAPGLQRRFAFERQLPFQQLRAPGAR